MNIKKIIIALSFTGALQASYASNFKFQNIKVNGSGCPSDSTQIILTPDSSAASIIFQNFESHVPLEVRKANTNPYTSELTCNVFLEIKLPRNQKLDSLEISYQMRGHAFLERGVSGTFKSILMNTKGLGTEKHLRMLQQKPLQEKNWDNTSEDQDGDFLLRATKSLSVLSNCFDENGNGNNEDKVSIQLQYQLRSQIQRGYEKTNATGTITIDTSDMTGGLKLQAHTSDCKIFPNRKLGSNRPQD